MEFGAFITRFSRSWERPVKRVSKDGSQIVRWCASGFALPSGEPPLRRLPPRRRRAGEARRRHRWLCAWSRYHCFRWPLWRSRPWESLPVFPRGLQSSALIVRIFGFFFGSWVQGFDFQSSLNLFLGMGRPAWKEARLTIQRLLSGFFVSILCWFDLIEVQFYCS